MNCLLKHHSCDPSYMPDLFQTHIGYEKNNMTLPKTLHKYLYKLKKNVFYQLAQAYIWCVLPAVFHFKAVFETMTQHPVKI